MADINTVYAGTTDYTDPDVIIDKIWPVTLPFGGHIGSPTVIYLSDSLRQKIREFNAKAISTVEAVKVPYTGKTSADRIQWLNDRINAINERVKLIKARTSDLLAVLGDTGDAAYQAMSNLVTSALKLVPVVGQVVSYFTNKQDQAQALRNLQVKNLIQDYAADLKQLGTIRDGLTSELAKAGTKTPTAPTVTNSGPTGIPAPYIYGGAAVIGALLIAKNRQNQHR